jgi:hypothetical protein
MVFGEVFNIRGMGWDGISFVNTTKRSIESRTVRIFPDDAEKASSWLNQIRPAFNPCWLYCP